MKKPGLADVQCSRLTFQPGDRVIVRHFGKLDKDQRAKLRKTVQRWAGTDVEVLIVDTSKMEITVDHREKN